MTLAALLCAVLSLASVDDPAAPPAGVLDVALAEARRDAPRLDAAGVRDAVAELATAYRARLDGRETPGERAAALAWTLFDHGDFAATDDLSSLRTLHVHDVVAERRGYCLSLTILALALADAVDEPFEAVALPHHVLVRWNDGETRIALELTQRGRAVPDDEFAERIGSFARDDTIYGRALTGDELRAMLLHNRAFVLSERGDHAAALADLDVAERLAPTLPEVAGTRGTVLGALGRWGEALEAFERALVLHPGDVDTLVNMALVRRASGDLAGAREDATMARLLDPSHPRLPELVVALDALPAARPLDEPPAARRAGLRVEYFGDATFGEALATGVTDDVDFDWGRDRPARGVPSDGFATRLSGWLEVREADRYTVFVVANDGVRVSIGDVAVIDHWRATGYDSWTLAGDVVLAAGWHPITVEHFERTGAARLVATLGRDGAERPLDLPAHLSHVP